MPYVHRTVVCGETVEHRKMYSSRVHSKEVKPRKRSSERETSKCQERINERVAEEHLRWLINCNYHYGDFHLVLHYWCKTITLEQAERDRAAFFRELRKAYAKAGKRLKYIAVLETKHMTNVHHHILLPRFDAQIIAAAWTKVTNGAGSISFQMLDDRKNHAKLASYLIKESRSTMRRCREQGITVVLITHHMKECIGADRVIVLSNGAVVADGAPKQVFSQVDLLKREGLTAPVTVRLLHALRAHGMDVPLDALTVSDCADAVAAALKP